MTNGLETSTPRTKSGQTVANTSIRWCRQTYNMCNKIFDLLHFVDGRQNSRVSKQVTEKKFPTEQ